MAGDRLVKRAILVNVALLVALLGYLASLSYPSTEATRLRNALLIDTGSASDLAWTPMSIPTSFRAERRAASAEFRRIVAELGVERMAGDWEKAVYLAGHLTEHTKDLGPIQADTVTAYRRIVREGWGYCSDFTQVYLALAHAAGLFAREWGFSLDGYGGHGHAFIEVYDRQRERWVWLDVHNNVHAVDLGTQEPLSATHFRAYVLGQRENVEIRRNGPGRLGYPHTDKLIHYYRRGAAEWYLWNGNAVFTYEASAWISAVSWIGRPVEQLVAIVMGKHPRIITVPSEHNAGQLERMRILKAQLYLIGGLGSGLFLTLGVLAWWYVRRYTILRSAVPRLIA